MRRFSNARRVSLILCVPLLLAAAKPVGPQPSDYGTAIDHYYAQALKDPASVSVYRVSGLFQTTYPMGGFTKRRVWTACVQVNAKNSYGGYTGTQIDAVYFEGDQILLVFEAWRVLGKEKCPDVFSDRDKSALLKP